MVSEWRYHYVMTLIDDGANVLLCGGVNNETLSTCVSYIALTNVWVSFASLPVALRSHTMLTLNVNNAANKQAFVFGGYNGKSAVNTVYTFDTAAASWIERVQMPVALQSHTAVALAGATALVCGGRTDDSGTTGQSACYMFESTTQK
jgi:hypothetical protein